MDEQRKGRQMRELQVQQTVMKKQRIHPILTDTHTFLTIDHIGVDYGEIAALQDVNLAIPANKVTGII